MKDNNRALEALEKMNGFLEFMEKKLVALGKDINTTNRKEYYELIKQALQPNVEALKSLENLIQFGTFEVDNEYMYKVDFNKDIETIRSALSNNTKSAKEIQYKTFFDTVKQLIEQEELKKLKNILLTYWVIFAIIDIDE